MNSALKDLVINAIGRTNPGLDPVQVLALNLRTTMLGHTCHSPAHPPTHLGEV